MSATVGFYELLEPYFAFRLAASNLPGPALLALRNSNGGLGSTLPGATNTLTRIVTELLDYLSVEELLTSIDENSIVYRRPSRSSPRRAGRNSAGSTTWWRSGSRCRVEVQALRSIRPDSSEPI